MNTKYMIHVCVGKNVFLPAKAPVETTANAPRVIGTKPLLNDTGVLRSKMPTIRGGLA